MEEIVKANRVNNNNEEDELIITELLDNESPFFLLQSDHFQSKPTSSSSSSNGQTINKLISKVYSGPTLRDIENALSITTTTADKNNQFQTVSQSRISLLQRGLNKIENNKYTLKLKNSGNGMADDGYKWRKYGQKSIKNSPFPRSYYRCTNPRCSAKKQVEKSSEDQETLIIKYEGLHLHFAYPYFLIDQPNNNPLNPPSKRPKKTDQQTKQDETQIGSPASAATGDSATLAGSVDEPDGPLGLLEDMVPFMIRNPSNNNNNNGSCIGSSCSPPTSPSSLSWSPSHCYSYFDLGINTSLR